MEHAEIVHTINNDPVAQTLLDLPIVMQLGYLGLDGYPRVVPILPFWDSRAFVMASPVVAYKVRAIQRNPRVCFNFDVGPGRSAYEARVRITNLIGPPATHYSPINMMGRGKMTVEIVPEAPEQYFLGSRRTLENDEQLEGLREARRSQPGEWALLTLTPSDLTIVDFVTRFPPPADLNAEDFANIAAQMAQA